MILGAYTITRDAFLTNAIIGWGAGRLIWTLDAIGHPHYSYLNGGLHAWLAANLPIENTPNNAKSTLTDLHIDPTPQVDIDYLLAHYQELTILFGMPARPRSLAVNVY